jgi:hypothetical protein
MRASSLVASPRDDRPLRETTDVVTDVVIDVVTDVVTDLDAP